ncbi:hypothetical protein VSH64_40595 [Amycolatopsis rhabdoformis]|uniref:Uncharacterized protein n=1 Tax=Amycolatopsis rhabdoformis TaxID=1448059 RepID=A0ABZ1I3T4_9PSEU|nr:hypothetical protein [Amycolatopsis rhabdoformis]WSE29055.1 hypothetical protein VSH64_40595 [Amycolatopsis rhabdoformis]
MTINELAAQLRGLIDTIPRDALLPMADENHALNRLAQADRQITTLQDQVTALVGGGTHLDNIRLNLGTATGAVAQAQEHAQIAKGAVGDALAAIERAALAMSTAADHFSQ